eukprot:RCo051470
MNGRGPNLETLSTSPRSTSGPSPDSPAGTPTRLRRGQFFGASSHHTMVAVHSVPSAIVDATSSAGQEVLSKMELPHALPFFRTVSLKWVAVALMCLCTIAPSLSLWLASWGTGKQALSTVQDLAQSSL